MAISELKEDAIFNLARKIASTEARADYLNQVCGENSALRARLCELLELHDQESRFLMSPAATIATPDEPIQEGRGTVIGPYTLLEQVGEGGFGLVYMAEQQHPVRRKVAIKVIKPGMDSRHVIARFEAERQALALMDHPSIAKVLDGGATGSGRPYFVMELVNGVPITDFCDRSHLTLIERLELFVQVCQAVQHAHLKGIIHRDLKPSNVLAALGAGDGNAAGGNAVVKVIDFGIAKALGQELTDKTLLTGAAQVLGTPMYMSPEQAAMSGDIDTRSDIYSLGILLYELLTGVTPFDRERLRQAGYDEVRQIIRQEEPLRPSTRLCTLGQAATTVTAQRQSDPKRLSRLLRGELDWIVMKALAKDRNRRYETAGAFAADVERYLHNEPVSACPPSAWYRFGKFARRRRAALVMGTVVGMALFVTALVVAASIGWVTRDRAAQAAALDERVGSALDEAVALVSNDKWPDASVVVERMEKLLLAADRQELPARLTELQRDLQMAQRLEDIFSDPESTIRDRDREYGEAFREFGIDLTALTLDEAASAMQARSIRLQLARSLDSWSLVRGFDRSNKQPDRQQLLDIARAVDPDPWHNRLREVLQNKEADAQEKTKLIASADFRLLRPASFVLIGRSFRGLRVIHLLEQAREHYPGDLQINLTLAGLLRKSGRHDEALSCYSAALALRPQSPRLRWALAETLQTKAAASDTTAPERRRLYLQAIAQLSRALELKPDFYGALVLRAAVYRYLGRPDRALADHSKLIQLRQDTPQPWMLRGNFFCTQGQEEKAFVDFARAFALQDGSRQRVWNQYVEQRHKALASPGRNPQARQGHAIIYGLWTIGEYDATLETGADIRFGHPVRSGTPLEPKRAMAAVGPNKPFEGITEEDLRRLNYSREPIERARLKPGTVFALKTSRGELAKVKVIRYLSSHDFDCLEAGFLRPLTVASQIGRPKVEEFAAEVDWVLYRK
jgi:serine/threonine protein kinase/Flp pilus assembly protein TadD